MKIVPYKEQCHRSTIQSINATTTTSDATTKTVSSSEGSATLIFLYKRLTVRDVLAVYKDASKD
jgi:hypothetical protein